MYDRDVNRFWSERLRRNNRRWACGTVIGAVAYLAAVIGPGLLLSGCYRERPSGPFDPLRPIGLLDRDFPRHDLDPIP